MLVRILQINNLNQWFSNKVPRHTGVLQALFCNVYYKLPIELNCEQFLRIK